MKKRHWDRLGNGGLNPIKKWWWDLELDADGGYHPTSHAVNERGLLPGGWTDGKYDVSRALESDERMRVRPPEARFLDVA